MSIRTSWIPEANRNIEMVSKITINGLEFKFMSDVLRSTFLQQIQSYRFQVFVIWLIETIVSLETSTPKPMGKSFIITEWKGNLCRCLCYFIAKKPPKCMTNIILSPSLPLVDDNAQYIHHCVIKLQKYKRHQSCSHSNWNSLSKQSHELPISSICCTSLPPIECNTKLDLVQVVRLT